MRKEGAIRNRMLWLVFVLAMYASATTHMAVDWLFEVHSLFAPDLTLVFPYQALVNPPVWVEIALWLTLALNILIADCLSVSYFSIYWISKATARKRYGGAGLPGN